MGNKPSLQPDALPGDGELLNGHTATQLDDDNNARQSPIPIIALLGVGQAGKSTLFRHLTAVDSQDVWGSGTRSPSLQNYVQILHNCNNLITRGLQTAFERLTLVERQALETTPGPVPPEAIAAAIRSIMDDIDGNCLDECDPVVVQVLCDHPLVQRQLPYDLVQDSTNDLPHNMAWWFQHAGRLVRDVQLYRQGQLQTTTTSTTGLTEAAVQQGEQRLAQNNNHLGVPNSIGDHNGQVENDLESNRPAAETEVTAASLRDLLRIRYRTCGLVQRELRLGDLASGLGQNRGQGWTENNGRNHDLYQGDDRFHLFDSENEKPKKWVHILPSSVQQTGRPTNTPPVVILWLLSLQQYNQQSFEDDTTTVWDQSLHVLRNHILQQPLWAQAKVIIVLNQYADMVTKLPFKPLVRFQPAAAEAMKAATREARVRRLEEQESGQAEGGSGPTSEINSDSESAIDLPHTPARATFLMDGPQPRDDFGHAGPCGVVDWLADKFREHPGPFRRSEEIEVVVADVVDPVAVARLMALVAARLGNDHEF